MVGTKKTPLTLILASTSPRRRQLLGLTGWMFTILPADVDETPLPGEPASAYVLRLAQSKARAVAEEARRSELILAADTTVADGDQILGKPQSAAEAMEMLLQLRGRVHQVLTAVALYDPKQDRLETDLSITDVPMRAYTEAEIRAYIATGDPFDKAGSYAIQHPEFKPVERLSGCYANVVGLPLCHLERVFRKFGVRPEFDLPLACQRTLQFDCSVYPLVQKGEL